MADIVSKSDKEGFKEIKLKLPAEMAAEIGRAKIRGNMFLTLGYYTKHGNKRISRYYRNKFSIEDAIQICESTKRELLKEFTEGDKDV